MLATTLYAMWLAIQPSLTPEMRTIAIKLEQSTTVVTSKYTSIKADPITQQVSLLFRREFP